MCPSFSIVGGPYARCRVAWLWLRFPLLYLVLPVFLTGAAASCIIAGPFPLVTASPSTEGRGNLMARPEIPISK